MYEEWGQPTYRMAALEKTYGIGNERNVEDRLRAKMLTVVWYMAQVHSIVLLAVTGIWIGASEFAIFLQILRLA